MYSLWNEASRDVESEDRMRRIALADADLSRTVFPFLALSKSEAEYEHRKVLAQEKIAGIAERSGASYDEVLDLVNTKMGYILEAMQMTAADEENFVIVDGNDVKIGGPYPTRESADAALKSGKFEGTPGAHVVSGGAGKTSGKHTKTKSDAQKSISDDYHSGNLDDKLMESEIDSEKMGQDWYHRNKAKHKKDSSVDRVANLIRRALEEGNDPIVWTKDLPSESSPEAQPSYHMEDSDPKANLPGSNIPVNDKEAGLGDVAETFMNAGQGLADKVKPMADAASNAIGGGADPTAGQNKAPGGTPQGGPSPITPNMTPGITPNIQNAPNTNAGPQISANPAPPSSPNFQELNNSSVQTAKAPGVTSSLDARIATMRDEIARYNPGLSQQKVNEIAHKVANRYLLKEQTS